MRKSSLQHQQFRACAKTRVDVRGPPGHGLRSPASGTIGRKPSYSDTSVPEAQLQMLNNWCAVLSFS
jgi:hypothetical protein